MVEDQAQDFAQPFQQAVECSFQFEPELALAGSTPGSLGGRDCGGQNAPSAPILAQTDVLAEDTGNVRGRHSSGEQNGAGGSGETPDSGRLPTVETPEMPTLQKVGKPVGISVGKSVNNQPTQTVSGKCPRNAHTTDYFRYELDVRESGSGYLVRVRRRLKWSELRYAPVVVSRFCGELTPKMKAQIEGGKRLTAPAIRALQAGGISDEFITKLRERIGRGKGRRRAELDELERSVLHRIESGIEAGRRERDARASGGRKSVGVSFEDVPGARVDRSVSDVPNEYVM